jgi:hypothetical protein
MDQSLFGDEPETPSAVPVPPAAAPIRDWQIDLLRKALDARGLTTMAERQTMIEELAGRPVSALRDLTQDEALGLLSKLGSTAPKSGNGSLWESRDEDTWIDRL